MLEYLNYASIDDDDKCWEYKLYEPNKLADSFNLITYFIASDDVNIAELQQYRKDTETDILIALNTTGKDYNCLEIADNIIYCSPDEIELAIYGLSFMWAEASFIGIDWNDVRTAISFGKNIQFLQSFAIGENCVEVTCEQLLKTFRTQNSKYLLKGMMISTFADSSFDFNTQELICNQMAENVDVDEANVFYQLNFFEDFMFWKEGEQGCCICMYLIYSDKETDTKQDFIEKNTAEKTTNSIQEYLKRQQQRSNNG